MPFAQINGTGLHYRIDGPEDGAPLVFSNSLGTDLRLWDAVLPLLPDGLRILRYDKRGHGLSDLPATPWSMGDLVADAATLMDRHGFRDAIFVGLSIGGMIAQGLAAERLDLVRAVVLSNTGAKIGTRDLWQDRIDAVTAGGMAAVAEATLQRWFPPAFHAQPDFALWRNMLLRSPADGWIGCARAIAETDLMTSTSRLRLPALGIAGSEDGSTPPDMVRETLGLIPGSEVKLIRGAGHLPCVDAPGDYAAILTAFLRAQGI